VPHLVANEDQAGPIPVDRSTLPAAWYMPGEPDDRASAARPEEVDKRPPDHCGQRDHEFESKWTSGAATTAGTVRFRASSPGEGAPSAGACARMWQPHRRLLPSGPLVQLELRAPWTRAYDRAGVRFRSATAEATALSVLAAPGRSLRRSVSAFNSPGCARIHELDGGSPRCANGKPTPS
jgi:hypothetical protein